ncbi:MAG: hypothetical protein WCP21_05645, partial [Armatimonadota bacterium]
SQFDFHCFDNSRSASARVWQAGYVACWNADAYGDILVSSAPHLEALKLQAFARNVVTIKPGKRFDQVIFLPEVGLRHGDVVSLAAYGSQKAPDSLKASVHVLKIDSQTGTWKPSDFGCADARDFPKHSRGELVKAKSFSVSSGAANDFQLKLENCDIPGSFVHKNESSDTQINSIALKVEFANAGKEDVILYAPCLVKGAQAATGLPELRPVPTAYTGIPRTLRKLWRGEPLHILLMGSSIDRGSANPPLYPFEENPASPKFKQPLADGNFNGELIGRPDLTDTVGQWRHFYAWGGRLRTELLRKFNYTPDKLLLNYMACDGSCISEATSGLAEYASLSLPPSPEVNGQPSGKTWQQMYPGLFERPGGPGPDLILFGSGANEKTDGADEGAIFEATIRWMQQRYPDCEFLFCQWQNLRGYTANTGNLMELSLAYNIPFMDMGMRFDQLMNYANRYALCPADGHPQAAGHYIWFKSLEEAFEVADPVGFGPGQTYLPRRLYPTSYGWEGELKTYDAKSPRIVNKSLVVLDDTTINAWGNCVEKDAWGYVDGQKARYARPSPGRNIRNSMCTYGRLSLGDRHVFELVAEQADLGPVDLKTCANRQWLGVDNPRWALGGATVGTFASQWGAPYGEKQVIVRPGQALEIEAVGTDLSVAYADAKAAGSLKITVDGRAPLTLKANVPFKDSKGVEWFMENRKGLRELGYGTHHVKIEAVAGTVAVLGLFTYDSRSNRQEERQMTGTALPGEGVTLTPPYKARPVVLCSGGLTVKTEDVTPTQVKFSGTGAGGYQIVGE